MDPNRKTMRHFYCRDSFWETFERMANDFDCSIDYLINEAMKQYAQGQRYVPPQQGHATGAHQPAQQPNVPASSSVEPGPGAGRGPKRPPPPPGPRASSIPTGMQRTIQPTGHFERAAAPRGAAQPPEVPVAPSTQTTGPLVLVFNNQRIPIEKDQFIIGRGSKTSDLAIKDGNISRKHAAVIRKDGDYYIKDLGSTNGIDFRGMRIDNKRIEDGDVFHLCDYELRFTFR